MLTTVRAADSAGVPCELHYAGRSRASMAFAGPLLGARRGRVTVYPAGEGRRLGVEAVVAVDPSARGFCVVEAARHVRTRVRRA